MENRSFISTLAWPFKMFVLLLLSAALFSPVRSSAHIQPTVAIHIDAANVRNAISPWMIGSCIEDVNHEIYGGLYAQQIFGESFEEPPIAQSPLSGWKAYGGQWKVGDGAVHVTADAGAKLIRETLHADDGRVACDIQITDNQGGNAALLLRVSNARVGADTWTGYEIALSVHDQALSVSRHHDDWHMLKSVPADLKPGRWHHVSVALEGDNLRVTLDHQANPALEVTDADPILTGAVGLRTWNTNASFRLLTVSTPQGNSEDTLARQDPNAHSFDVSGMWDAVHTGSATAQYGWDSDRSFNSAYSQKIVYTGGTGTVGLANRGLNRWGIAVREGHTYAGRLYLRGQDFSGSVTVGLQSANGAHTYAKQQLTKIGPNWQRYDFKLRSNASNPNARFALWIDRPGTVEVDQVTLMPTGPDLFHNLPIRADIANAMVAQGLTFLRYGGSMVNAPTYRWKSMTGNPDLRPQANGMWYPHSTNGFGIVEFVEFCEAAHIEPAFAVNIEETPQDMADLVDYFNGSAATVWGRKRVANGHARPYRIRTIEIGNEETLGADDSAAYAHYLERFKLLYEAMHARDPALQLVIAAWWRPESLSCKRIVQELSGKAALWDVHVGGDNRHEGAQVERTLIQMKNLFQQWSPGTTLKAAIFEENGSHHDLERALGHASILNVTRRMGDFVRMDCPANCLQPWKQNDNGWDQGQVFFTPAQVWGMPPFYAQQMAAQTALPLRVQSDVSGTGTDMDVTAMRDKSGETLALSVVNVSGTAQHAMLDISGFADIAQHAECWSLSGELGAVNTPEEPERIRSVNSDITNASAHFAVDFAPCSYTVIRLKRVVKPR